MSRTNSTLRKTDLSYNKMNFSINSKFVFYYLAFGLFMILALAPFVNAQVGPDMPSTTNNTTQANAVVLQPDMWYNDIKQDHEHWFKLELNDEGLLHISVIYSGPGNLTLELYRENGTLVNSSYYENGLYQVLWGPTKLNIAYLRVIGPNQNGTYSLNTNFFTVGDGSGFYISDDYLSEGYQPQKIRLMGAYLLMASVIMLYIQFGISFISKAGKTDNSAQKTYYRGLGAFVISVALSESTYIFDLLSRDLLDHRFFLKTSDYPDPFQSLVEADYYVASFFMLLFALTFLIYPMEKYLYAHKRKVLTIVVATATPFPLIIRFLEANHKELGFDIDPGSFEYQMFTLAWAFLAFISVISFMYLLKLYLDLGRKAPEGSKLRRKSHQIVWGILIWVFTIFAAGTVFKEISAVDSIYAPWSSPLQGTFDYFIWQIRVWYIFPFIPPSLLLISLALLVNGFTRDY